MEPVAAGIWSIVPPIVAIVLALITKEVVFSLMMGILSGAVIYSCLLHLGVVGVFQTTASLMGEKLGGNASMILFLCFLGILVAMVTRAGGSRAYGEWAVKKLKTKRTASLATSALGILIFIDDYFNCLTVGTVMRPVTDRFRMSREKLAYIIDATAAPVCIIAPISSWAASVISYFPSDSGINPMTAFLQSIPMNLYAVLTLVMVIYLSIRQRDYGPMAKAERRAQEHGIVLSENEMAAQEELSKVRVSEKGKVADLVIPIVVLIAASIFSMLFVGGFFDGTGVSLFDAFGNTDAAAALALGALVTLIFAFLYFIPRKLLSFKEFFGCVNDGVISMVPACVILTMAWTISGVCRDLLLTGPYVAELVEKSGVSVALLPAIIFIVACLLSFSTGTAWGTFGILIPIVLAICESAAPQLTITVLSATLAGSVFGDHCPPISDTTILASTGAGCNHISHVSTQIPYTCTVAVCCFIGYLIAGFTGKSGMSFGLSTLITLAVSLVLLFVAIAVMHRVWSGEKEKVSV